MTASKRAFRVVTPFPRPKKLNVGDSVNPAFDSNKHSGQICKNSAGQDVFSSNQLLLASAFRVSLSLTQQLGGTFTPPSPRPGLRWALNARPGVAVLTATNKLPIRDAMPQRYIARRIIEQFGGNLRCIQGPKGARCASCGIIFLLRPVDPLRTRVPSVHGTVDRNESGVSILTGVLRERNRSEAKA
jgi:hypothetical protein